MKSKLVIYLLPFVLLCFVAYGFVSQDDPRNDSYISTVTPDAPSIDGKISSRPVHSLQADTTPPAGFPYRTVFNWNYSTIGSINAGSVGACRFNNRFHLNRWNAAIDVKFAADGPGGGPGTRVDSNSAYNAGAGAIRDMTIAPDGSGQNYLWGGSAGTVLYKLDSLGNRLASYTHTGAGYRAIAWDPNRKGFWSCNFAGNLVCRDTNGVTLGTVVNSLTSKYGMGFDSSSTPGAAYLWVWEQGTTTTAILHKFSLASGTEVNTYTFTLPGVSVGIAGGAEVQAIDTNVYLFLNYQNYAVVGYDLKNPIALLTDDVGTSSINNPPLTVGHPSTHTPQATVTNFGSLTQTFNVTMKITPGAYSSTKTVTGLASLSNTAVNFDPYSTTGIGAHTITVYTELGSDLNRSNDTLRRGLTVIQPNFGTVGSYSFSNNVPGTGAPSQPQYCWKDTAGSTSLVVNSVNSQPGIFNGTLDDGHWKLGNKLGGKKIRFGGVAYDSFFVATNGTIGFAFNSSLNSFSPTTTSTNRPAFYPLWMDMNLTANASYPVNRVSYRVADGFQLIITYDRIPEYLPVGTDDYVSFQVVIDLVDATYTSDSRLMAQYADASAGQTGAGFITFYNNNTLNNHVVGLQTTGGTTNLYYRAAYPLTFIGPLFAASPVAVQFGPDASRLNHSCGTSTLDLTARFEGPFISATNFNDPVTVHLRSSTPPYEVADGDTKVLSPSGTAIFDFGKIGLSATYYIVVRSRFGIETWSTNPVSFAGPVVYNFTAAGQAFGDNVRNIGGTRAIYVGDVNQDGIIDGSDGAAVDNDAFNFAPGFGNTDLNWDGVVDGSDAIYTDNNAFNFVGVVRP